jgi:putative Mg2+ transporter-C (MgtC) family protein
MDLLWHELGSGMPDVEQSIRVVVRLIVATLAGAIIGFERERTGKSAGLRTHMLVALSSAIFILGPLEANMSASDVSRIVQGVAAGIGFLGAGTILKLTSEGEVRGLTTAAGIWLTAAVGIAAGLGRLGLAMMCAILASVILGIVARMEVRN